MGLTKLQSKSSYVVLRPNLVFAKKNSWSVHCLAIVVQLILVRFTLSFHTYEVIIGLSLSEE